MLRTVDTTKCLNTLQLNNLKILRQEKEHDIVLCYCCCCCYYCLKTRRKFSVHDTTQLYGKRSILRVQQDPFYCQTIKFNFLKHGAVPRSYWVNCSIEYQLKYFVQKKNVYHFICDNNSVPLTTCISICVHRYLSYFDGMSAAYSVFGKFVVL